VGFVSAFLGVQHVYGAGALFAVAVGLLGASLFKFGQEAKMGRGRSLPLAGASMPSHHHAPHKPPPKRKGRKLAEITGPRIVTSVPAKKGRHRPGGSGPGGGRNEAEPASGWES